MVPRKVLWKPSFKDFIKPFEAPQRSVEIKILINFFSSSGKGTGRVKGSKYWNRIFVKFLTYAV